MQVKFTPTKIGVDEDLEMAAKETTELMKKKQEVCVIEYMAFLFKQLE